LTEIDPRLSLYKSLSYIAQSTLPFSGLNFVTKWILNNLTHFMIKFIPMDKSRIKFISNNLFSVKMERPLAFPVKKD